MARSPKEAIAIIIDIGHSVAKDSLEVKPGFLEKALQCVSMIVKRKIFSFSKDEIAFVLLGTQDAENNLDYEHITVPYSLRLASWELLEFLEKELKGTSIHADWLDAVVVAMDLLKEQTEGKVFSEKKIVLLTDLKSPVADDKVDVIISSMKKEGYQLIVIGPDTNIQTKEDMDVDEEPYVANGMDKSKPELDGEVLLSKILNKAGGVICNFDEAVPQLMYFQKKVVRPTPWNVVMDIGPDVKIPVSGYKKITSAKLPSWKTTSSQEKGIRIESETTFTRQDENQTTVEADDVIPGYSYGTTLVPMSDVDKDSMSYKSGSKCLSVLGFTKSKNVPRHLLIGDGVMYFTAQKNDDHAMRALSALINAMNELNLYAIARKVYRDNLAPRLGVLLPKISSYECLVFVELPYSEDMREFVFPPIATEKTKPSQEQIDAIDSLIDNMDLTSVKNEFDEPTEAFKPKNILNPYHQHVYHSLAFRALNPDAEQPPVKDDVLKFLRSPYEDKPGYKLAVDQIKRVFQLTEVEQKSRPKAAADLFKVDENAVKDEPMEMADLTNVTMASLIKSKIIEVGSVKPVEDFKDVIEQGQPFVEVCSQMQKVIATLVVRSFGTDSFDKAASALGELRSACAEKDPSIYNEWIPKFRETLFERGKTAFWKKIVEDKLGMISSHESVKSSVTEADSRNFLEYEEPKEEEVPVEDAMDEDDLLNQM